MRKYEQNTNVDNNYREYFLNSVVSSEVFYSSEF